MTSRAAPAIMTAAMTRRRSSRSEMKPTGKTPSADPITIADVKSGARSGGMPMSTAKTGPSANEAPFAAPAARTARHEIGATRVSHRRRGRTLRGSAGGSTLVIAIGTIARANSAAATAKGGNPGSQRLEGQLARGGGAEISDLVEGVERAAIGVGRLGVDPCFDHRIYPQRRNQSARGKRAKRSARRTRA